MARERLDNGLLQAGGLGQGVREMLPVTR